MKTGDKGLLFVLFILFIPSFVLFLLNKFVWSAVLTISSFTLWQFVFKKILSLCSHCGPLVWFSRDDWGWVYHPMMLYSLPLVLSAVPSPKCKDVSSRKITMTKWTNLAEIPVEFSKKSTVEDFKSCYKDPSFTRKMDNDVLTTLKILIIGESGVGKSRYEVDVN